MSERQVRVSFHSKFNGYFDSPNSNIFKFAEVLKNVQIDTIVLIKSVSDKYPEKA